MLHCWELEHTCRPTFSDLVGSLSQSLESMAGYLDVGAFGHLMEAIENPGVEDHDSAETESRIMDLCEAFALIADDWVVVSF